MQPALTWIDLTSRDRDQMRRVLDLLSEQGTVDEMGLGTIRDAFADALFPGTSSIKTRLRYALFVPWIYRALESKRRSGEEIEREAREAELALVGPLKESGDTEMEWIHVCRRLSLLRSAGHLRKTLKAKIEPIWQARRESVRYKYRLKNIRLSPHRSESAFRPSMRMRRSFRQKNGRRTRASRTWQMVKRHGILIAAERAVMRPKETAGYSVLVQMGLQEHAFEAVILRHPEEFSVEALAATRARLE